ncbi:MAG: NADH-quinone oxidoreductase subunit F [Dehalococcoidia bacterium]|nr:NADH-quinone oxidoreductase subunit F [Dehalococcoidia bacterium]
MESFLRLLEEVEGRRTAAAGRALIQVGIGSCSMLAGAVQTLDAARQVVATESIGANVSITGCNGMCWAEPLVVITRPGEAPVTYGQVDASQVAQLIRDVVVRGDRRAGQALGVEGAAGFDGIVPFSQQPFFQVQRRNLLARCGVIDPESVDEYLLKDGYAGLDRALTSMTPEDIVKELMDANLTGRGGANFPAGRKWDFLRTARATPKYMVCNADEGDPGAFVNRILLESDPHQVIEGMAIGGYTAGAEMGFIYIRDEYPLAVERARKAIDQARQAGLLGQHVLGSDFNFDIQVVRGAGAYVCGEETGLIASIQDYRGMPRIKPPFPAQSGVFFKPTNVNNVETYAYAPGILRNGVEWFSSVGTERNKGTKLFSLSGRINRVCIVEVDIGTPMRTLLEVCAGGIPEGHTLKGVQQGGPLGGVVPADWLDTAMDPANFNAEGTIMGSGGLIFLDERDCIVDICHWLTTFDQDESCGRCTTCRIGSMRMVDILGRMTRGTAAAVDLQILQHLEGVMQNANCVHGQFTPKPFNAAYKWFKTEFDAHVFEHRCPSGACRAMTEYVVDPAVATGAAAEALVAACPVRAIEVRSEAAYILDEKCVRCGLCLVVVPGAVSVRSKAVFAPAQREVRYS